MFLPRPCPVNPTPLAIPPGSLHSCPVQRRFALGLTGIVLLTLPATCKVYPDSLLDPRPGASTTEPQTGLGFWSGTQGECFSARQPTDDFRPAPSDAPDIEPFFLGLDQIWLGGQRLDGTRDKDAWQDFGFDLDGTCTASPTCEASTESSCKRNQVGFVPDGNHCRDNNFGKLQNLVSGSADVGGRYGLNNGTFNCGLCYGKYNLLIRVSEYNGTDSDDQVRVDIYRSPGLELDLPLSTCDDDPTARLCWWVANEAWKIDRKSTTNPSSPSLANAQVADGNAFVRDGYLVARFPAKSLFWFPGNYLDTTTFPIQLSQGIVSARLSRAPDNTYRMTDGVIGGRITSADLIQSFRWVGLCEGDPLFPVANSAILANVDITADPDAGPDATCDALSVGIVFSARQANVGKIVDGPDLVECPPPPGTGGAAGQAGSGGQASSGASGQPGGGAGGGAGSSGTSG